MMRPVPTSSDDWPRLAAYLDRRARYLGLTQTDIAARRGPSTTLWRDLIKGTRSNYAPGTLGKADRALDWEPGSSERVLRGAEPTPLSATVERSPSDDPYELLRRAVARKADRDSAYRAARAVIDTFEDAG